MLNNNRSNVDTQHVSNTWRSKNVLAMTVIGTFVAGCLGALFWLTLTGIHDQSQMFQAMTFGFIFGGWVGFIACLLFSLIRPMREYGGRSVTKAIMVFALLGSIAASPVFVPFADGWRMAIGGLIEGAIFGAVMGAILGLFFFLMMFRQREKRS